MTDLTYDTVVPLSEYLGILKRRRRMVLAIAATIFLLAAAGALFWPPTYESVATILIEDPEVPAEMVKSTVTGVVAKRLQVIQQRVMTTENLIGIMDKTGLYAEMRQTTPINLIVDAMRDRIFLELITSDAGSTVRSRTTQPTIAFNLSFQGSDPTITQRVANELVTLYLAENQRSRTEKTASTTGFLTSESQRLSKEIDKLESEIAAFKAAHAGELPEDMPVNTQLLDRTSNQQLEIMRQIQSLRERQALLQSQLAAQDPHAKAPVAVGSQQQLLDPQDQLRLLQAQFTEMRAKFGDKHPDVVNLRRQIESLSGTVGGGQDLTALNENLQKLESALRAATQKYGDAHPEVVRLRREIEAARTQIDTAKTAAAGGSGTAADNPTYVMLQSQLNSINAEISAAKQQADILQKKSKEIELRMLKGPEVESAYVNLKRDYELTLAKYNDISSKESQARLADSMESEQMGEKLSVIEPPLLPVEPIKPNRRLVLAIGMVIAAASGVGSGILADAVSGRVYGASQLSKLTGMGPMAVIPVIRTRKDRVRRYVRWVTGLLIVAILLTIGLIYINYYVTPLDVLWLSLLNRLGVS